MKVKNLVHLLTLGSTANSEEMFFFIVKYIDCLHVSVFSVVIQVAEHNGSEPVCPVGICGSASSGQ